MKGELMNKIEELLAVLDLPEDEQINWLYEKELVFKKAEKVYTFKGKASWRCCPSLADLAFRLRDEVNKVEFHHCIAIVAKHLSPTVMHYAEYALCTMKPIHWIIAALIAKEKP